MKEDQPITKAKPKIKVEVMAKSSKAKGQPEQVKGKGKKAAVKKSSPAIANAPVVGSEMSSFGYITGYDPYKAGDMSRGEFFVNRKADLPKEFATLDDKCPYSAFGNQYEVHGD